MELGNGTRVKEFIFLGLTQNQEPSLVLFLFLLLVYVTTLLGNLLIMVTVTRDSCLHTPMYFLLRNLSVADICFSSITAPKVLADLLVQRKAISFNGCFTQMFFFHLIGGVDAFSLSLMALDRYVAITKPQHYVTVMSRGRCIGLIVASWAGASSTPSCRSPCCSHSPSVDPTSWTLSTATSPRSSHSPALTPLPLSS